MKFDHFEAYAMHPSQKRRYVQRDEKYVHYLKGIPEWTVPLSWLLSKQLDTKPDLKNNNGEFVCALTLYSGTDICMLRNYIELWELI